MHTCPIQTYSKFRQKVKFNEEDSVIGVLVQSIVLDFGPNFLELAWHFAHRVHTEPTNEEI